MGKFIELVSSDEYSGRAFIYVNGAFYLLEKPCAIPTRVDEIVVGMSIAKHDFKSSNKKFDSFEDLNHYLRRRTIESHLEEGINTPTHEETIKSCGDLLVLAPVDIVDRYLERVEEELLPNGEWFAASKIVENLSKNKWVRNDTKRLGKCSKIHFKICISILKDYIRWFVLRKKKKWFGY